MTLLYYPATQPDAELIQQVGVMCRATIDQWIQELEESFDNLDAKVDRLADDIERLQEILKEQVLASKRLEDKLTLVLNYIVHDQSLQALAPSWPTSALPSAPSLPTSAIPSATHEADSYDTHDLFPQASAPTLPLSALPSGQPAADTVPTNEADSVPKPYDDELPTHNANIMTVDMGPLTITTAVARASGWGPADPEESAISAPANPPGVVLIPPTPQTSQEEKTYSVSPLLPGDTEWTDDAGLTVQVVANGVISAEKDRMMEDAKSFISPIGPMDVDDSPISHDIADSVVWAQQPQAHHLAPVSLDDLRQSPRLQLTSPCPQLPSSSPSNALLGLPDVLHWSPRLKSPSGSSAKRLLPDDADVGERVKCTKQG